MLEIDNTERQVLNAYVRFQKSATPCWKPEFWANEGLPQFPGDQAYTEAEMTELDELMRAL